MVSGDIFCIITPPLLACQIILPRKFDSPNISSHSNFNLACSLSSIEIKITPSFFNNYLAIINLG